MANFMPYFQNSDPQTEKLKIGVVLQSTILLSKTFSKHFLKFMAIKPTRAFIGTWKSNGSKIIFGLRPETAFPIFSLDRAFSMSNNPGFIAFVPAFYYTPANRTRSRTYRRLRSSQLILLPCPGPDWRMARNRGLFEGIYPAGHNQTLIDGCGSRNAISGSYTLRIFSSPNPPSDLQKFRLFSLFSDS